MKRNFLIIILFLISCVAYAQQPEWLIFKAPSRPIERTIPNSNELSIGISMSRTMPNSAAGFSNTRSNIYFESSHGYSSSLPANFVVCMVQDGLGDIWVGTFSGGIARFNGTKWDVYNTSNSGLTSNVIYSIAIDKNNNKWIGTINGLVKYDGRNWKVYNSRNSRLPHNMIYSIAIDHNDNKWIGTANGLAQLSGNKWKVFNTRSSKLPHDQVTALSIDKNNNKWIGTFEGLAKYDGVNWKIFKTTNSALPYNDIYSIVSDRSGNVYIDTWGGGLAKYAKQNWTVYKSSNSGLPDDNVSSSVVDKKGNLWIGTLNGLAKYDGNRWRVYNTSNSSLPNNMVYSLISDAGGNLWVGTENGLAVFNEEGIVRSIADVTEFTATVEQNSVHLYWEELSKTSCIKYEIERRAINFQWKTIASIVNRSRQKQYYYTDEFTLNGNIDYRIKQTDTDGKIKYSKILSVLVSKPNKYVLKNIQFNSGETKIRIQYGLPEGTFTNLIVKDILGREAIVLVNAEQGAGYHEVTLDSQNLHSGFYYYQIKAGNYFSTKKFVLMK